MHCTIAPWVYRSSGVFCISIWNIYVYRRDAFLGHIVFLFCDNIYFIVIDSRLPWVYRSFLLCIQVHKRYYNSQHTGNLLQFIFLIPSQHYTSICSELHLLGVNHVALTRSVVRKNLLSPNSLVLIDGGNQGIAICSIFSPLFCTAAAIGLTEDWKSRKVNCWQNLGEWAVLAWNSS